MPFLNLVRMRRHPSAPVPPPVVAFNVPSKVMGINTNYHDNTYLADSQTLGVDSIRVELWNETVTNPSGNSTTAAEAHSVLAGAGISMLPLVNNYTVDWTSPTWEQAAVAAIPYADYGVIEIANEPFLAKGWAAGQEKRPIEYAQMVVRCANAIAATGSQVKVLAAAGGPGGTATWPSLDYFTTNGVLSQASAGNGWIADIKAAIPTFETKIAGWTIHPYQMHLSDSGPAFITSVESFTSKELWITEGGYKADPANSTEESTKSSILATYVDSYLLGSGHNIRAMYWYNHKDYSAFDPSPTGDNGWALVSFTNVKVPAWATYQARSAAVKSARNPQSPDAATTWTEINTPLMANQTFVSNPVDINNSAYTSAVGVNPNVVGRLTANINMTLYYEVSYDAKTWVNPTSIATTGGTTAVYDITYSGYPYGRFRILNGATNATQTKLTVSLETAH